MYASGMRDLNLDKPAMKSGDADSCISHQSVFDGHVSLYGAYSIYFEI